MMLPIKVLKCEHRFCLNCLAACLSGKNEEVSKCPACKINILKTDISPSSDFQTLLLLLNPLSANPTKWSDTLKQFVGNLPTNCLSVFDHFMSLALKGLKYNAAHVVKHSLSVHTIITRQNTYKIVH